MAEHLGSEEKLASRSSLAGSIGNLSKPASITSLTTAAASSFFTKINRTLTNQLNLTSNTSSKHDLSSLAQRSVTVSHTGINFSEKEHIVSRSGDESTHYITKNIHYNNDDNHSHNDSKTEGSGHRRAKSATSEYADPNTLPPLAPLVIGGDVSNNSDCSALPSKSEHNLFANPEVGQ